MMLNVDGMGKAGTMDLYDVFAMLIRQWELPEDRIAKVARDIILQAQEPGKD